MPEHHPGYVSWEEYLATRERLRANVRPRGEGGGAAREGLALLQGILRCGRCGRRMQVAYSGTKAARRATRACARFISTVPSMRASHSAGCGWTARWPPRSLKRSPRPGCAPARRRSASSSEQHEERLRGQRLAVERAEFEADRAQRQFDACEPENRSSPARWSEPGSRHSGSWRASGASSPSSRGADPSRSPRRSVRRSPSSRRTCRGCGTRRRRPPRDRKELLRTLVSEVVVTVNRGAAARGGRDHLGGRRAQPASGATDPPRRRAQPHQRGHHRADPSTRRAHQPIGRSPRSSTSRAGGQAPGFRSTSRASNTCASNTASRPPRHRTPTVDW